MISRLFMTWLVWIVGIGLCTSGILPGEQLHPELRDLKNKGDILMEMSRHPLNASQRNEFNEIVRQARTQSV